MPDSNARTEIQCPSRPPRFLIVRLSAIGDIIMASAIPIPAPLVLFGSGLCGLLLASRRRRRAVAVQ